MKTTKKVLTAQQAKALKERQERVEALEGLLEEKTGETKALATKLVLAKALAKEAGL